MRWFLLLLLWYTTLPAEMAVAHPDVAETQLCSERLRDILLGRVTTWPGGAPIVIILSEEASANAAQQRLTNRDLSQLLRGWKRLVYGGNGAMPVVRRTTAEAVQEARRRPGALVIVAADADTSGLVVLYRGEHGHGDEETK